MRYKHLKTLQAAIIAGLLTSLYVLVCVGLWTGDIRADMLRNLFINF